MTTFKIKKIITVMSLFTMIFSLGSNVNAMNVGLQTNTHATENYRNNIYYGALDPKIQSEIYQLHTLLWKTYKCYHRHNSQDDFRQILQHINVFLDAYNDKPGVKQKIVRVIGISTFENGYIVNTNLFRNFLGKSKSMTNLNFQKLGFFSKSVKIELLHQTISQIDKFECRQWSLKLPDKQSVHNNPQNEASLINANDIQNNLSISNADSSFVPQDNLVLPNQDQYQLENINLQNEQSLNSNINNKFDFFQPEDYGFENHNDYDPFADFTTNWNNSFSNSSLFDSNF